MQIVFVVLLLGSLGQLQAGPLPSEPLLQTQENFNLNRFMGKWYDIASASNCPWRKKHKGDSPPIGSLELQRSDEPSTLSMKRIMSRHGVCKMITGNYELTETPGRFYYHSVRWSADVDAYVVHTNYDEYALVVMMKQQRGGNKTTSVRLYGRKMELRPTLLDDFKTLVAEQGMGEDTISIKQNKGECTPGEQTATEPQVRARRAATLPPPEEGSGIEMQEVFRGAESCTGAPDPGPCFGMIERYHYNSTLMACQSFTYGGCMGNQNNFGTEKECLQTCRTEAACRLLLDAGPCTAAHQLWAFNSTSGKCVSFKYGGCKGNGNKFYSQKECEEYCGVTRDGEDEFLNVN